MWYIHTSENVISVTGQMRATQRTHYFDLFLRNYLVTCQFYLEPSAMEKGQDLLFFTQHNCRAGCNSEVT